MAYDPAIHHRRSIRLKGYDYSLPGPYFITICSHQFECIFGSITGDRVQLTAPGKAIHQIWIDLPKHYPVELDEFILMPNHLHAIIGLRHPLRLEDEISAPYGAGLRARPASAPKLFSLSDLIQRFKSFTTNRYHNANPRCVNLWHRNYYEHIIRNDRALEQIREYIYTNPLRWNQDQHNFDGDGSDMVEAFLAEVYAIDDEKEGGHRGPPQQ